MAKNITIHNPAPIDRQGWVECIVPEDLGPTAKFTSGTIVWPAVRGRQRYTGTPGAWVYRIKALMTGNQIATGSLATDAAPPGLPSVFKLHPWVADDLNALIPEPRYPTANDKTVWKIKKADLIEQSLAHQTWHIRRHNEVEGLIFECFLRFKEDDPVVEMYAAVIWSTRKTPALVKRSEGGLFIATRELLAVDTALRLGASPPLYMGAQQTASGQPFEGEWKTRLKFDPAFMDGSGYAFTGRLCCFIGPDTSALGPGVEPSQFAISLESLAAGAIAPMVACCTEWGTAGAAWMTGSIPRIRGGQSAANTIAFNELLTWANLMAQPVDWHQARPLGLTPHASTSGNQEDFGHTKGFSALAGLDPKWIMQAKHSVYAEMLRGGMLYEDKIGPDLHLLLASEHPQWVPWNGYSHFSLSQSPDQLGKKLEVYGERESVSGWVMEPDQWHSLANRQAYRGLTDDPLMDLRSKARIENYQNAIYDNAARAFGRHLQYWADDYALAVGDADLQAKILKCVDKRLLQASSAVPMNVSGPMKVLIVQNDPRKEIYNPVTGFKAPSASMWETALACVGLARWQGRGTASATLEKLLTTLALYGCWKDTGDDTWYTVDDLWYQGAGVPPTPAQYFLGSPQVILGRGNSVNGGAMSNTHDWTFVGILLASKLLPAGAARTQAAECVAWWTGNQEATARDTAEWWSIVDAIPVVP